MLFRILDAYIGKTLVKSTGLVLTVLVGLSSILKYVDQLRKVGKGSYDLLDAGLYVLYSMPRDLELFFPVAALLGALIGLGMLASNSELVVMQAAGWSKLSIVGAVMKTAIPLVIVMMAVGEWVVPVAEQTAKEMRTNALSGGSLITAKRGTWAKDGEDFVYIGHVISPSELHNVTQYHFGENGQLNTVAHYSEAIYQEGRWLTSDVSKSRFFESEIQGETLSMAEWHSTLTPDKLSVVTVKPESLSIQGLSEYLDYLKDGKQETSRYELALWRKILQPFSVAVMMLLALSFIFGPLRNTSMGARIIMGVVAGFGFNMADQLFGPLAIVLAFPTFFAAALPSLIFTLIAIGLLKRA